MQGMLSSFANKIFQMSGWMRIVVIAAGVLFAIVAFILYESGSEMNHHAKKWLVSIMVACGGVMLAEPFIQGIANFFGGFGGGF